MRCGMVRDTVWHAMWYGMWHGTARHLARFALYGMACATGLCGTRDMALHALLGCSRLNLVVLCFLQSVSYTKSIATPEKLFAM